MKKINNALSNEVYEYDNLICKKYISNDFKIKLGNNDFQIRKLVNQEQITIKDNMFCYKLIKHEPFHISKRNMDLAISSIKKFHQIKDSEIEDIRFEKAWKEIKKYSPFPKNELGILQQAFEIASKNKVLLHNDLVDGNLLIEKDKVTLIDFEYSGYGNEMIDVVSFLSEREMTLENKKYFLEKYYQNTKPNKIELDIIMKFSLIFWATWASYMYSKTSNKIYLEIVEWKIKDYKSTWWNNI